MKIYIKHKQNCEIKEIEGKNYLSLSKNIRNEYLEASDEEKSNRKLEQAVELKKAEINKQREEAVNRPVAFTKKGKVYNLSSNIKTRLAFLENGNRDLSTEWVADDNTFVEITKSEFKELTKKMGKDVSDQVGFARKRKDEVIALGVIEEGDNVEERITEIENYDITKVFID
tara:strand:- start:23407 stop:23922 length:516 start_codon:yes stop_codon:yes gene_type:complete